MQVFVFMQNHLKPNLITALLGDNVNKQWQMIAFFVIQPSYPPSYALLLFRALWCGGPSFLSEGLSPGRAPVFVSQAKLVTSVKKGKSVCHSAHWISPKIGIFANKRFSSCYKLAQRWRHYSNWNIFHIKIKFPFA